MLFSVNYRNKPTAPEKGFTKEATEYMLHFDKHSILNALDNLCPNDDFTYFTKGLNTHEVLVKLLEVAGPSEITIASYSLTELPMRVLANLKEKKAITHLTMLLDNTVYRTQNLRQFALEISDKIAFTEIHAKVILIKSKDKHLVYKSSSNLTKNHRYELGNITDHKGKYEFFESKINDIINECNA